MQLSQSILGFLGLIGLRLPVNPKIHEPSFPSLPFNHPASVQFTAWLVAFNTADKKTLLEYHSGPDFPYSVASRDVADIDHELGLAILSGGFKIVEVESSLEPSTVVIVLKEMGRSQYGRASMIVDVSKPNYPVIQFDINPITTPIGFIPADDRRRLRHENALKPLTISIRKSVVYRVCEVLREQYVDQELAEQLISALKTHLVNGDYNDFVESQKFAERLTADLEAVGHDQHMGVHFFELQDQKYDTDDDIAHKPVKHLEDLRLKQFGFGSISLDKDTIPDKTIAILPIEALVPSDEHFASDWKRIQEELGKILSRVADADALVVDLRDNHGGSPDTVAFILSYLLDNGATHRVDKVDHDSQVEQSFSALTIDILSAGTPAFGGVKPLVVLTTGETISGGKEMAYNLQAFKWSGAVTGDGNKATSGAANPVTKLRFICEDTVGDGWWIVTMPSVKPVHAVTGTN